MYAHVVTYPALQRRLIAQRRTRALFLRETTQHMTTCMLLREVARAAIATIALTAWCTSLLLLLAA